MASKLKSVKKILFAALFISHNIKAQTAMRVTYYHSKYEGLKTASGAIFSNKNPVCAHKYLPFGSTVIISYNGKRIPVEVVDRLPQTSSASLDVSQSTFAKLAPLKNGVIYARLEYIKP